MTVPKFHEFMLPVLRQLDDGAPRHWRDLRKRCIDEFQLTDADLAEEISSGMSRVDSRILWANTYLFQAGLLDRPRRGLVVITERGRDVLADPPDAITLSYLRRFPEFREFQARTKKGDNAASQSAESTTTVESSPLESIADAVAEAKSDLEGELLKRIVAQPPEFLEQLAVKLLNKMGYGDAAGSEHRGRPGDAGIDGAIRQDALGLNTIYMQAKRYSLNHAVQRPDIQAFVGALHGAQADRGVFITTSRFTDGAREYTERIPNRIVLIDGQRLAQLMVQHDIGVEVRDTFVLKRIDEDFFDE